jgi:large subunit ribosomal protein L13
LADETPTTPAPATTSTDAPPPAAPAVPAKPAAKKSGAKASGASSPAPKKAAPAAPAKKPAEPARPPAVKKTPLAKPRPAGPPATVVDASGLILGRAASLIAQRLLRGESIVVVHAERSVVTGDRARVIAFYTANRARGSVRSGPHFPRYPDRIFRRTVRGMLPHLKTRGKVAFDRLEVHIGCPDGVTASVPEWVGPAKARPALRPPVSLGEVSRLLGARV